MGSTAKNNVLLSHLPIEIVEFQMLTRLPVKSLLRFKSVCKSWKSLISENQVFMHTHLANSNNDYCLMLSSLTRTGGPSQTLIGCINGLLCFCTWQTFGIKFTISNPATKHLLDIRALPVKSNASYAVGFGFDSVTNDYKVVCIRTIMDQPLVGRMYSTSAHRWTKIAPSNFHYSTGMFFLNSGQPVIVNESLYWLNLQTGSRSLTVISFDFRHQVFRMLPDSFDEERGKDPVLVNMRGSVALLCYDPTLSVGSTIDVYIFNERCSTWSKMYIGPLIGKEPSFGLVEFMACLRNNDMLFGSVDLKLYRVNPETHTINSIESSEEKGDKSIFDCCTYSESLIFIQGMETLPLYDNDDEDLIDASIIEKHYLKSGLIFKCSCIQI